MLRLLAAAALYPAAWVRVRLPERRSSVPGIWGTVKFNADVARQRRLFRRTHGTLNTYRDRLVLVEDDEHTGT